MAGVTSICISSAYYPPHTGGVEVYTKSIAHELAKRGVAVTVVTSGVDDSPAHEFQDDGVEVFRLPAIDPIGRYPMLKASPQASRLWKGLTCRNYDAIVVNTRFYPLSLKMLGFAQKTGIRPVLIEHGSGYLTFGNPVLDLPVHAYENSTAIKVRAANPACYGVSREACEWMGHFGLKALGTIHNSIDIEGFKQQAAKRDFRKENDIPGDACLIAFTGRIIPEKGVWVLAEAARMLDPNTYRFLLAGDGADFEELKAKAPENMTLLGRLDRPNVAALLEAADIFCFPSASEGLPTSVLEAAACGAFIIATPVGGISEIIPNPEYGTVLQNQDSRECADAIRNAFADSDDMRRRAELCRQHIATEFSWEKAADDLLAACENAQ